MALVVQKFGGTSVGSVERIRAVAERVHRAWTGGERLVVVVSAMAGETNRLLGLGHAVAERPDPRELDALAATGEQASAALLAIALRGLGAPAVSLLGHQVRIETDSAYTKARIRAIDVARVLEAIDEGRVAVVAGFQGVDARGNITTLGRGGSDTTAVAIAAALDADRCDIFTDVEGVYTADPAVCPSARKIPRLTYEEMLELASLGAKVLQIRSVEVAMKYGVPVHVRSSFSDAEGTLITSESEGFEEVFVSGVTYDRDVAKVTVAGIREPREIAAAIFQPIAKSNVSVDMIIQGVSSEGTTDLTFTVAKADGEAARDLAQRALKKLGGRKVLYDRDVAKVSIVGLGMRSHAGIASSMFGILANEGIPIEAVSTSEIKVSCLVASRYTELAVRSLHDGFGLGAEAAAKRPKRRPARGR
jgi:aspartate kinase